MILWAAVAAVFVLGCVNIGGMLLARSSGRVGEIATRLALGAPLSRIVRQLLTESIISGIDRRHGWRRWPDGRVWRRCARSARNPSHFSNRSISIGACWPPHLVLTLIAGIGFGLVPAWQASRVDLRSAQTGSRTVAGRKRFVSLGTLVGGQVALDGAAFDRRRTACCTHFYICGT